ncbi:hypothetical protein C8Q76DRAFT_731505 [Earliella scabrosa]|nr:hypothetical protein C8Q76DRAFT_731505 [Earliella scabrosa]
MTSMLDKLLAADIPDPTDFPDNAAAPGLRPFDDAVRCNICRDFYDAPVTLSCGHGFCSACIRSALPEHQLCPTCRKPASEGHIRKDVAMETAVHAWKAARPLILRLAREDEARKKQPVHPPHSRQNSNNSERSRNKRRRLHSPASGSDEDVQVIPSSPAPTPADSSPPADSDLPSGLVECPVCKRPVPFDVINPHIDSGCTRHLAESSSTNGASSSSNPSSKSANKSKQKQQWSSIFGGTGSSSAGSKGKDKDKDKDKSKGKARATPDLDDPELEHLPKVAYDIHPQKRIAEMLAEWDLPTHGDKAALVRRHKRWVVAYNANVDRAPAHRLSLDQLRAEQRRSEDTEHTHKTRKETVDDPVAYQRANKDAFAKLTEAARPRKPASGGTGPGTRTDAVETNGDGDGERERDERGSHRGDDVPSMLDVIDVDVDDESAS